MNTTAGIQQCGFCGAWHRGEHACPVKTFKIETPPLTEADVRRIVREELANYKPPYVPPPRFGGKP